MTTASRIPAVTILGLLIAGATPGSAAATSPVQTFPASARHAGSAATARPAQGRRRALFGGCGATISQGFYFIGISNGSDTVAGEYGAVLGGNNNEACDTSTGVGAGSSNVVGGNGFSSGSFIGSGAGNQIEAMNAFLAGGAENEVNGNLAFLGAGAYGNAAGNGSFVGAGDFEYASNEYANPTLGSGNGAEGTDAFVGAGDLNVVTGNGSAIGAGGYAYAASGKVVPGNQISGSDSFIGAGDVNVVTGNQAFLGGGNANTVNATEATLSGGYANTVASAATFSAIGGGNSNVTMGTYETIGGGYDNVARGADAVIPGGNRNEANGELSFAAGYQAHALYTGSFVWSDYHSGSSPLADSAADQFVVRASGGTYIYSNEADTAGVKLAAGSGAWSNLSDRNAKTNIVPLDDDAVLAKVATLPLSVWQYKTERGVHHVGPMAQDFYAAFGVGEDDRHITSIDEDGVALAAIKALSAKLKRVESQMRTLCERNARLERRLAEPASHR